MEKFCNIKSDEGYTLKGIFELFHSVFDKSSIIMDKKGIHSCNMNNSKTIMIDFNLGSENFSTYDLKGEWKFSIESSNLPKVTKTIKKKDKIALIRAKGKDDIRLRVKDSLGERKNVNDIPVHDYSPCEEGVPDKSNYNEHTPTATVNSSDFQKMCKTVYGIDKDVTIRAQEKAIIFEVNSLTIKKHSAHFGKWLKSEKEVFTMKIPAKTLIDISKCSSLSKKLRIYAKDGQPLLISTDVGGLGAMDIYILDKPKE